MDEAALFLRMRQTLSQWADFEDSEWNMLENIFRIRKVEKGETLLRPGETAKGILFVCSGLLRYFYRETDGREVNKAFLYEDTFSSPLTACALDKELGCGVQALEPTVILVAEAAEFNSLYDAHPVFDRMGRKLGEWWMARKESRTRAFQSQDARERYLDFIRMHGSLAQRLPQYHIASYLGIAEVSLSRIRRGLARPSRGVPPSRAPQRGGGGPGFRPGVTRQ
jgi:CRP-like cAMP-binding protein